MTSESEVGQAAYGGASSRYETVDRHAPGPWFKVEAAYLNEYESYDDVAVDLPRFIDDVYNTRCLRSSLEYLSPTQFEDRKSRQPVKKMPPEAVQATERTPGGQGPLASLRPDPSSGDSSVIGVRACAH